MPRFSPEARKANQALVDVKLDANDLRKIAGALARRVVLAAIELELVHMLPKGQLGSLVASCR